MATTDRLLVLALGTLGCTSDAECQRRIDAAWRDALHDAPDCTWDPGGVSLPDCGASDRRPLFTYEGVWCSTAELVCIRSLPEADDACFGAPAE